MTENNLLYCYHGHHPVYYCQSRCTLVPDGSRRCRISFITSKADTPLPRENISNETLQLLDDAANKLSVPNKGIKRPRSGSPTTDHRAQYPSNSKQIYLKTKTLHKRKLALAANLHQIKQGIAEKKYPNQVNFRCSHPPNRDERFKSRWQDIIRKCKEDLTCLVIEDLDNKYQSTKAEIQGNMDTLGNILSTQQFSETKQFLDQKYKAAIPAAMSRANGKFNRRERPRLKQTKPSWRNKDQTGKARRGPNKKGNLKEVLNALMAQL